MDKILDSEKKKKQPTATEIEQEWKELEQLLQAAGKEFKPQRLIVLNEIFKAVIKLAKDNPGTLNLKITATVLKELRYSFKLFSPHKTAQKITIFGSARVPPGTELYKFAKQFAVDAVKKNYQVITGGGPGIMAAGNEGAEQQGFGLNIRLPFEQSANPFINKDEKLINYKYFFTRKLFLVKEAAAFTFFPGGFGTFDEAFEVLTLLQTGKSTLIPVIFMEPKGYGFWDAFFKFVAKDMAPRGFISDSDKHLYRVMNTSKEAIDHIQHFYSTYHSMRFVKDKVAVRLNKPISEKLLQKIHKEFPKLSLDGKYTLSGPLPEEGNEPELAALHRLVFPCDKKDFAGLRCLVDVINDGAKG